MSDELKTKIIFRTNLNRLIQKKGVTQRDVADALKVTPSTVNEWVKGKKVPRMDKIDKLCSFFLVPRSALLEEYESQKNNLPNFLNAEETDVLNMYRNLNFVNRQLITGTMKSFLSTQNFTAEVVQNNQNGHNFFNSNGNSFTNIST